MYFWDIWSVFNCFLTHAFHDFMDWDLRAVQWMHGQRLIHRKEQKVVSPLTKNWRLEPPCLGSMFFYRGCKCFFFGGVGGGKHDNNDIERLGHDIPFCRPRQMEQAENQWILWFEVWHFDIGTLGSSLTPISQPHLIASFSQQFKVAIRPP